MRCLIGRKYSLFTAEAGGVAGLLRGFLLGLLLLLRL